MKITKQELLNLIGNIAGAAQVLDVGYVAVATAQALGYEVVEGPALPERIAVVSSAVERPCKWRLGGEGGRHLADVVALHAGLADEVAALLAEVVHRYNIKGELLGLAAELERDTLGQSPTAKHLRAIYQVAP